MCKRLFDGLTKHLIAKENLPILGALAEKSARAKRSWCEAKELARDAMAQLEASVDALRPETRGSESTMETSSDSLAEDPSDTIQRTRDEFNSIRMSVGGPTPSLPPLTEEDSAPSSLTCSLV